MRIRQGIGFSAGRFHGSLASAQGHLSKANLKKLASGLGKQSRMPFGKKRSRAKELLEIVHSDICGPMKVPSLLGSRYYIVFVDDKSRRMVVYFLRTKSEDEVLRAFQAFHVMAERQQIGSKIKTIRTDNGDEDN